MHLHFLHGRHVSLGVQIALPPLRELSLGVQPLVLGGEGREENGREGTTNRSQGEDFETQKCVESCVRSFAIKSVCTYTHTYVHEKNRDNSCATFCFSRHFSLPQKNGVICTSKEKKKMSPTAMVRKTPLYNKHPGGRHVRPPTYIPVVGIIYRKRDKKKGRQK